MTINLQEQSCTGKDRTSLRESTTTPSNDKKSDKLNKDLSKRSGDSKRKKTSSKKEMKDKNLDLDKSSDVTLLLADSIIKDVKRWELTDESNNFVVKSFR